MSERHYGEGRSKKNEVAGTTGVVRTTSGRGAIGIIAQVIYSASEMRRLGKK